MEQENESSKIREITESDSVKEQDSVISTTNNPGGSQDSDSADNQTAGLDAADKKDTNILAKTLLVSPEKRKKESFGSAKQESATKLPLFALNHISFQVQNLDDSVRFYEKVMGFVIIKRPDVFDYAGVWMFGHGVAIHLQSTKGGDHESGHCKRDIVAADNHISFQCSNLYSMLRLLQTSHVHYERFQTKIDGKIVVNRINFRDPDGHIIEVADSQNLPIVPLLKWPPKRMPSPNLEFITTTAAAKETVKKPSNNCTCEVEDKANEDFDLELNITSEHHLLAVNHVGYLYECLEASLTFYKEVLGFVSVEVPKDENWNDKKYKRAWLFGHGIGIHLIQGDCACPSPQFGLGFQCTNMYDIMTRLDEMKIRLEGILKIDYEATDIKVDGIIVNQISTKDPDCKEIVFCTLQNLPIIPISDCPPRKMPTPDPFIKELPCKPKWPLRNGNKVEEECYEVCYKTCKPKVISKPKVVKCCEEIVIGETMLEEIKPGARLKGLSTVVSSCASVEIKRILSCSIVVRLRSKNKEGTRFTFGVVL